MSAMHSSAQTSRLEHVTTFCGNCSCGCPELFVDREADAAHRIVLTDDFGQKVHMSAEQFGDIIAQAKSGALDAVVQNG